jgi:hypothetical protein
MRTARATALALFPGLLAAIGDGTLRGRSLEEWRALIEPRPAELAYAGIPWLPSFHDGLLEAQREERPLLLWTMNGHPLGCT